MERDFKNIIFDLGGVLIDWDPKRLFSKIFNDPEEMTYFLSEITTMDWNIQQDRGRPLAEATRLLQNRHPEYFDEIAAYYGRWEEMLGGPIQGTVEILHALKAANAHHLYALTNWSQQTWPIAQQHYQALIFDQFEGILVSGEEKLIKPDPAIYQLMMDRYELLPAECVFIDDNTHNVQAAEAFGIRAHHFQSPEGLHTFLQQELGIELNI